MQSILSASQMINCENNTINNIGIGSLVLMERAGLFAASACLELKPKRVLVLCGVGNNGADGIVVARLLRKKAIFVDLLLIGNREKASKENLNQLKSFIEIFGDSNIYYSSENINFDNYDLFVDGLFGINLNRELSGDYLEAVCLINDYSSRNKARVVALDIPSGLNSTTGHIYNQCVVADVTVSFGFLKLGHYLDSGRNVCGKILLDDVGIELINDLSYVNVVEKDDLTEFLHRKPVSNKGNYGKMLIIAGNNRMPGAALMASYASFKSGAGMVCLVSGMDNKEAFLNLIPEAMLEDYDSISDDCLSKKLAWCDAVLIGPGLGLDSRSVHLVEFVSKHADKTVIYDADALNILADNIELLNIRKQMGYFSIVTPHPIEFARLFRTNISDKRHQDIEYLNKLSNEYGTIIVAKDATTIVASAKEAYINTTGNPGMSCAGSGDVLSGIIASLVSKAANKVYALALAVFLHGLAGDYAKIKYNETYMTPSNIIESIKDILGGE